jgi:hypothetical protein
MEPQSLPSGQHMTASVPALFKVIHCVFCGQHQSEGWPVPQVVRFESPPQVVARGASKLPKTSRPLVPRPKRSSAAAETADDIARQTAVKYADCRMILQGKAAGQAERFDGFRQGRETKNWKNWKMGSFQ